MANAQVRLAQNATINIACVARQAGWFCPAASTSPTQQQCPPYSTSAAGAGSVQACTARARFVCARCLRAGYTYSALVVFLARLEARVRTSTSAPTIRRSARPDSAKTCLGGEPIRCNSQALTCLCAAATFVDPTSRQARWLSFLAQARMVRTTRSATFHDKHESRVAASAVDLFVASGTQGGAVFSFTINLAGASVSSITQLGFGQVGQTPHACASQQINAVLGTQASASCTR